MERRSMRPWEQKLLQELRDLEDAAEGRKQPLAFFGNDVVRVVSKEFGGRIGVDDIRARMNDFGYRTMKRRDGSKVQRRVGQGRKEVLWCRASDVDYFAKLKEHSLLIVDSLFGAVDQGD
jgi:hypothetical protein